MFYDQDTKDFGISLLLVLFYLQHFYYKMVKCPYFVGIRTMKEPIELEQKYQRLGEIFAQARQRYLEAGGDPHRAADNRYLTDEEKKEAFELGA